jgi:hypothetical protein
MENVELKKMLCWKNRKPARKAFGGGLARVTEEVARFPSINYIGGSEVISPNIFCMRIDADECHDATIRSLGYLFIKYHAATTVFVNVSNFISRRDIIEGWHEKGVDIQSHGFYHHTYSDYANNLHNIRKARLFFEKMGIQTEGFVSPAGRWNRSLSAALGSEGYKYSSEFSYDYLSLPTYPDLGGRLSGVLNIPVFPVAPELFLEYGVKDAEKIAGYYMAAIDEMQRCGLPVIIYAHTSKYKEIPVILDKIYEYALFNKHLTPSNMTRFGRWWRTGCHENYYPKQEIRTLRIPGRSFLGDILPAGPGKMIKRFLKEAVDFERVTPPEELRGPFLKKEAKKVLRKML